jgi:hypothetical protein
MLDRLKLSLGGLDPVMGLDELLEQNGKIKASFVRSE